MMRRGTLREFDAATYTATVEVEGSRGFGLAEVPVSRAIPLAELVVGRAVCLAVFDATNPADAVVVGIY